MDQIDCFDGVNLPRRSGVNLLRRTGDNFSVFFSLLASTCLVSFWASKKRNPHGNQNY